MSARFYVYWCISVGLVVNQSWAQQPASTYAPAPSTDSVALQQFLETEGPAEAVFSFGMTHSFRFKSGVYTIGDATFPLLNSPDSLVRFPVDKAYKRHRRARISSFATAVPLALLAYSATRVVLALGAVASGQRPAPGVPSAAVIRASGIGAVVGILVTATFNISSFQSLFQGVKRHNEHFGRRYPSIFNPKGL